MGGMHRPQGLVKGKTGVTNSGAEPNGEKTTIL